MKNKQWERSINTRARWVLPITVAITVASFYFDWGIKTLAIGLAPVLGLSAFALWKPKGIAVVCILGLMSLSTHAMTVPSKSTEEYMVKFNKDKDQNQEQYLAAAVVVTVVLVFVGHCVWKCYKGAQKAGERRRKQIEKQLTNDMLSANSFIQTTTATTGGDSLAQNFCFTFVMGGGVADIHLSSQDISIDDFRPSFGLPLDDTFDCHVGTGTFAVRDGNTFIVSMVGRENVRVTVRRSPDMVTWTDVGTLEAPKGLPVSFEDGEVQTDSPAMFYQLVQ